MGFSLGDLCRAGVPWGGKKWYRSVLLIATGFKASGYEGNLRVFLGATSYLAVQKLFGEVFARKSAQ